MRCSSLVVSVHASFHVPVALGAGGVEGSLCLFVHRQGAKERHLLVRVRFRPARAPESRAGVVKLVRKGVHGGEGGGNITLLPGTHAEVPSDVRVRKALRVEPFTVWLVLCGHESELVLFRGDRCRDGPGTARGWEWGRREGAESGTARGGRTRMAGSKCSNNKNSISDTT